MLESDGIENFIDGCNYHVRFVLGIIIGDNLGLNKILGYTTCFNSNYYCRSCKRKKNHLETDFVEIQEDMRTKSDY